MPIATAWGTRFFVKNPKRLAPLIVTLGLIFGGSAWAQTLLLYQANPAAGTGLPSLAKLDYEALEKLTGQVAGEDRTIAAAVGFTGKLETALVPGGYKLRSDPSLVTAIATRSSQATLLAAAFGYVFRQDSVLVVDLGASDGDQFFARVRFHEIPLSGGLAEAFFQHAAKVDPALGEGYTAFDNTMLFINLRDDTGKSYGGLDNDAFLAALNKAVTSFTAAKVSLFQTGKIEARFVGNDWRASPQGGEYRILLPAETLPALDAIQARIASQIRDAAGRR